MVKQLFLRSFNKLRWGKAEGAGGKGNAVDFIKDVSFKNDGISGCGTLIQM